MYLPPRFVLPPVSIFKHDSFHAMNQLDSHAQARLGMLEGSVENGDIGLSKTTDHHWKQMQKTGPMQASLNGEVHEFSALLASVENSLGGLRQEVDAVKQLKGASAWSSYSGSTALPAVDAVVQSFNRRMSLPPRGFGGDAGSRRSSLGSRYLAPTTLDPWAHQLESLSTAANGLQERIYAAVETALQQAASAASSMDGSRVPPAPAALTAGEVAHEAVTPSRLSRASVLHNSNTMYPEHLSKLYRAVEGSEAAESAAKAAENTAKAAEERAIAAEKLAEQLLERVQALEQQVKVSKSKADKQFEQASSSAAELVTVSKQDLQQQLDRLKRTVQQHASDLGHLSNRLEDQGQARDEQHRQLQQQMERWKQQIDQQQRALMQLTADIRKQHDQQRQQLQAAADAAQEESLRQEGLLLTLQHDVQDVKQKAEQQEVAAYNMVQDAQDQLFRQMEGLQLRLQSVEEDQEQLLEQQRMLMQTAQQVQDPVADHHGSSAALESQHLHDQYLEDQQEAVQSQFSADDMTTLRQAATTAAAGGVSAVSMLPMLPETQEMVSSSQPGENTHGGDCASNELPSTAAVQELRQQLEQLQQQLRAVEAQAGDSLPLDGMTVGAVEARLCILEEDYAERQQQRDDTEDTTQLHQLQRHLAGLVERVNVIEAQQQQQLGLSISQSSAARTPALETQSTVKTRIEQFEEQLNAAINRFAPGSQMPSACGGTPGSVTKNSQQNSFSNDQEVVDADDSQQLSSGQLEMQQQLQQIQRAIEVAHSSAATAELLKQLQQDVPQALLAAKAAEAAAASGQQTAITALQAVQQVQEGSFAAIAELQHEVQALQAAKDEGGSDVQPEVQDAVATAKDNKDRAESTQEMQQEAQEHIQGVITQLQQEVQGALATASGAQQLADDANKKLEQQQVQEAAAEALQQLHMNIQQACANAAKAESAAIESKQTAGQLEQLQQDVEQAMAAATATAAVAQHSKETAELAEQLRQELQHLKQRVCSLTSQLEQNVSGAAMAAEGDAAATAAIEQLTQDMTACIDTVSAVDIRLTSLETDQQQLLQTVQGLQQVIEQLAANVRQASADGNKAEPQDSPQEDGSSAAHLDHRQHSSAGPNDAPTNSVAAAGNTAQQQQQQLDDLAQQLFELRVEMQNGLDDAVKRLQDLDILEESRKAAAARAEAATADALEKIDVLMQTTCHNDLATMRDQQQQQQQHIQDLQAALKQLKNEVIPELKQQVEERITTADKMSQQLQQSVSQLQDSGNKQGLALEQLKQEMPLIQSASGDHGAKLQQVEQQLQQLQHQVAEQQVPDKLQEDLTQLQEQVEGQDTALHRIALQLDEVTPQLQADVQEHGSATTHLTEQLQALQHQLQEQLLQQESVQQLQHSLGSLVEKQQQCQQELQNVQSDHEGKMQQLAQQLEEQAVHDAVDTLQHLQEQVQQLQALQNQVQGQLQQQGCQQESVQRLQQSYDSLAAKLQQCQQELQDAHSEHEKHEQLAQQLTEQAIATEALQQLQEQLQQQGCQPEFVQQLQQSYDSLAEKLQQNQLELAQHLTDRAQHDATEALQTLQQQVQQLQEQDMQSELQKLLQEVQQLRHSNDECVRQIQQAEQQLKELQDIPIELVQLDTDIQRLRLADDESEQHVIQLEQQVQQLQQQDLQSQLHKLLQEVQQLQQSNEAYARCNQHIGQLQDLPTQLVQLDTDIERLRLADEENEHRVLQLEQQLQQVTNTVTAAATHAAKAVLDSSLAITEVKALRNDLDEALAADGPFSPVPSSLSSPGCTPIHHGSTRIIPNINAVRDSDAAVQDAAAAAEEETSAFGKCSSARRGLLFTPETSPCSELPQDSDAAVAAAAALAVQGAAGYRVLQHNGSSRSMPHNMRASIDSLNSPSFRAATAAATYNGAYSSMTVAAYDTHWHMPQDAEVTCDGQIAADDAVDGDAGHTAAAAASHLASAAVGVIAPSVSANALGESAVFENSLFDGSDQEEDEEFLPPASARSKGQLTPLMSTPRMSAASSLVLQASHSQSGLGFAAIAAAAELEEAVHVAAAVASAATATPLSVYKNAVYEEEDRQQHGVGRAEPYTSKTVLDRISGTQLEFHTASWPSATAATERATGPMPSSSRSLRPVPALRLAEVQPDADLTDSQEILLDRQHSDGSCSASERTEDDKQNTDTVEAGGSVTSSPEPRQESQATVGESAVEVSQDVALQFDKSDLSSEHQREINHSRNDSSHQAAQEAEVAAGAAEPGIQSIEEELTGQAIAGSTQQQRQQQQRMQYQQPQVVGTLTGFSSFDENADEADSCSRYSSSDDEDVVEYHYTGVAEVANPVDASGDHASEHSQSPVDNAAQHGDHDESQHNILQQQHMQQEEQQQQHQAFEQFQAQDYAGSSWVYSSDADEQVDFSDDDDLPVMRIAGGGCYEPADSDDDDVDVDESFCFNIDAVGGSYDSKGCHELLAESYQQRWQSQAMHPPPSSNRLLVLRLRGGAGYAEEGLEAAQCDTLVHPVSQKELLSQAVSSEDQGNSWSIAAAPAAQPQQAGLTASRNDDVGSTESIKDPASHLNRSALHFPAANVLSSQCGSSSESDTEPDYASAAAAAEVSSSAARWVRGPPPVGWQLQNGSYRIAVHTSEKPGSGTRARVMVCLAGASGNTYTHELSKSTHRYSFQEGSTVQDWLQLSDTAAEPAGFCGLRVWHDGPGYRSAWLLDWVLVQHVASGTWWQFRNSQGWLKGIGCSVTSTSAAAAGDAAVAAANSRELMLVASGIAENCPLLRWEGCSMQPAAEARFAEVAADALHHTDASQAARVSATAAVPAGVVLFGDSIRPVPGTSSNNPFCCTVSNNPFDDVLVNSVPAMRAAAMSAAVVTPSQQQQQHIKEGVQGPAIQQQQQHQQQQYQPQACITGTIVDAPKPEAAVEAVAIGDLHVRSACSSEDDTAAGPSSSATVTAMAFIFTPYDDVELKHRGSPRCCQIGQQNKPGSPLKRLSSGPSSSAADSECCSAPDANGTMEAVPLACGEASSSSALAAAEQPGFAATQRQQLQGVSPAMNVDTAAGCAVETSIESVATNEALTSAAASGLKGVTPSKDAGGRRVSGSAGRVRQVPLICNYSTDDDTAVCNESDALAGDLEQVEDATYPQRPSNSSSCSYNGSRPRRIVRFSDWAEQLEFDSSSSDDSDGSSVESFTEEQLLDAQGGGEFTTGQMPVVGYSSIIGFRGSTAAVGSSGGAASCNKAQLPAGATTTTDAQQQQTPTVQITARGSAALEEVPLAAARPIHKPTEYQLRVYTADRVSASLPSGQRVMLEILGPTVSSSSSTSQQQPGQARSSPAVLLSTELPREKGSFKRGCVDRFTLYSVSGDVGEICAVRVWHEPDGVALGNGWYLDKIEIEHRFKGVKWRFSSLDPDGCRVDRSRRRAVVLTKPQIVKRDDTEALQAEAAELHMQLSSNRELNDEDRQLLLTRLQQLQGKGIVKGSGSASISRRGSTSRS